MERNGLIRNGCLSFVFNRSQCSKCLKETGLPDELWHSEHSAHVCCLPHVITFTKAQLGTLDAEAVRAHGQFKLTKNNHTFTTCLLHALRNSWNHFSIVLFFSSSHTTLSNEIWLHVASNHFLEIWNIGHFFLCFHVQSRSSKKTFTEKKFLRKSTNCYANHRYHWAQKRHVTPDASQYRIAFSITGMHILDPRWMFQSVRLHPLSRWIIQLLDISC